MGIKGVKAAVDQKQIYLDLVSLRNVTLARFSSCRRLRQESSLKIAPEQCWNAEKFRVDDIIRMPRPNKRHLTEVVLFQVVIFPEWLVSSLLIIFLSPSSVGTPQARVTNQMSRGVE